jgi:hypothetical protein
MTAISYKGCETRVKGGRMARERSGDGSKFVNLHAELPLWMQKDKMDDLR